MLILRDWINQRLEYRYLTDMTGEAKYWNRIREMEHFLDRQKNYPEDEPYKKENWIIKVKAYLQSCDRTTDYSTKEWNQYLTFIRKLESSKQLYQTKSGVWYVKELPYTNNMNNR